MNVLFILARYPGFGGIEKVSTILCNSLCKNISWVGIYSFVQQNEKELLQELSANVHFIKANDTGKYYSKRNIKQLSEIVKSSAIGIVVYQDSYAPYFRSVVSAIKGLGSKLIVVEHNTPEQSLKTSSIKDIIRKDLKHNNTRSILAYYKGRCITRFNYLYRYIKCDKYILLSKMYESAFKKLVPFASNKKLGYISNPNYISATKLAMTKKKICLFCGRLELAKGVDYLMEIWSEVERQRKDWQLVVVGDGSQYSYISEYIKQHNLTNVHLAGYQQDTSKYYSRAQIFLMPSRYEGWGISLFEAKAFGCIPIMFNSFTAASDVINSNVDGFLIPPYDIDAYIHQLLLLMDDEEQKSVMSKKAQEDINRFSVEKIIPQWLLLFESLMR